MHTSWPKIYFQENQIYNFGLLNLMQDLNLRGDMNVSNLWSITNVKKYCLQIGVLCSVSCLV